MISKLSALIIILLLSIYSQGKSPHGNKLTFDCNACHSSIDWTIKIDSIFFDHSKTKFKLIGQHLKQDCRKCHVDLVFSNAKTACNSCHKDMHRQTIGQDCERCHSPISWHVENIIEIHQKSRFPLNGRHEKVDCYQCHKSASLLQ